MGLISKAAHVSANTFACSCSCVVGRVVAYQLLREAKSRESISQIPGDHLGHQLMEREELRPFAKVIGNNQQEPIALKDFW